MRIKCRPEDFRVSEENRLAAAMAPGAPDGGEFGVYRLAKRALATQDAIRLAARRLGVPLGDFRYAGQKDRWAVTDQVITVRSRRDLSAHWEGLSLVRLGRSDRHVEPGDIVHNRFEVTVRALPDRLDLARAWSPGGEAAGMVNYYDDQRFGSVRQGGQYAGEALVRRDWAGALYLLLAAAGPGDLAAEAGARRRIAASWGDWAACARQAPARRRIFELLAREPRGFRGAANLLPAEELAGHLGAWQAHIYNRMLRRAVGAAAEGRVRAWPGVDGDYLFPEPGGAAAAPPGLAGLSFPTAGRGMRWPDPRSQDLGQPVLEELGLRPADFVVRGLARYQLRSFLRPAWVEAAGLEVLAPPGPDPMHPGRFQATIGFRLPPGAYATMGLKQLACRAGLAPWPGPLGPPG